jgi:hypothetical protein
VADKGSHHCEWAGPGREVRGAIQRVDQPDIAVGYEVPEDAGVGGGHFLSDGNRSGEQSG